MRIVGVSCDDAIFRPVHDRRFVDAEASCSFRCRSAYRGHEVGRILPERA